MTKDSDVKRAKIRNADYEAELAQAAALDGGKVLIKDAIADITLQQKETR